MAEIAQEIGKNLMWMLSYVFFQSVKGDEIKMHGKINLSIIFRNVTYHRVVYIYMIMVRNLISDYI